MPPRKRASRQEKKFNRLLDILGVSAEEGSIQEAAKAFGAVVPEHERLAAIKRELELAREREQLEAESVLFFVANKGKGFETKTCKRCGNLYAAAYIAVDYCSNKCRAASLADIGIMWNVSGKTDLEKWGGRIPKVLGPQALRAAVDALQQMNEDEDIENQETISEFIEALEEVPYVPPEETEENDEQ